MWRRFVPAALLIAIGRVAAAEALAGTGSGAPEASLNELARAGNAAHADDVVEIPPSSQSLGALRQDAQFIERLVVSFHDDGPSLFADMESGPAIEDGAAVARAAHRLKSGAAAGGALHLSELAATLEHCMVFGRCADLPGEVSGVQEEWSIVEPCLGKVVQE